MTPSPETIRQWVLDSNNVQLSSEQCMQIISHLNTLEAKVAVYEGAPIPLDYDSMLACDMFYLERRYTKEAYLAEDVEWDLEEDAYSDVEPVVVDISIDYYGTIVITRECDELTLNNSEYNKTWRAWSEKPDEDDMKEAEWDD